MTRDDDSRPVPADAAVRLQEIADRLDELLYSCERDTSARQREMQSAWREIEFLRRDLRALWDDAHSLAPLVERWAAQAPAGRPAPSRGRSFVPARFQARQRTTDPRSPDETWPDLYREAPLDRPDTAREHGRRRSTIPQRRSGVRFPADPVEALLHEDHSVERQRLEEEATHAITSMREQVRDRIRALKAELERARGRASEARRRVEELEGAAKVGPSPTFGPASAQADPGDPSRQTGLGKPDSTEGSGSSATGDSPGNGVVLGFETKARTETSDDDPPSHDR